MVQEKISLVHLFGSVLCKYFKLATFSLQLDFTNWGINAPFGESDCARMKSDIAQLGQWTDKGTCDDNYRYVCKKDKSK